MEVEPMRWILGLIVLGAVGAGAWLLLDPRDAGEARLDGLEGREEARREQGPVLEGAGGPGGRARPAASGRSSIECFVTREGRPTAAVVEAHRLGGSAAADFARFSTGMWVQRLFAPPAPPAAPTASAEADAQGRASLLGLAPGVYRVTGRTADGAQALTSVTLATDGARAEARLELASSSLTLDARVAWSDGRPAPGTLVLTPQNDMRRIQLVLPAGQEGARRAEIRADGTARVEGLAAGTYDVRALLGESVAVTGPPATVPAQGAYVLTVSTAGQRLTGRVLEAGGESPVPGATVVLMVSVDGRSSQFITRLTSDADGRFAGAVPGFPVRLAAEAPGFAPAARTLASAGGEITVRLARSARVAGRVTAPDGSGAAGAVVVGSATGPRGGLGAAPVTVTADRDGRYALEGLAAGEAQIVVRGGGWVSVGLSDARPSGFNPFLLTLPAGGSLSLDLPAERAGRIEGRVLDAGGAPVAGASVSVRASRGGRAPAEASPDTAASDPAGSFVLDSLVPGTTYTLSATAPEQPRATAGPFSVASDAATPVEIRFAAPRYVDVRVLFEVDESPVAGARVVVMTRGERSGDPYYQGTQTVFVTTDVDGRAHVGPAGEGPLSVLVAGAMLVTQYQPTQVEGSEDGSGPFSATLHVARGLTIEGRVLKPDGTPAVGAQVEADSGRGRTWYAGDVVSGGDGAFTLTGVAAGSQALRATLRPAAGKRLTGRASAEAGSTGVTITLGADDAGGGMETFTFHVLDDHGEPVPSGSVRLVAEGSSAGTSIADGWGTLETSLAADSSLGRGLAKQGLYVEVSDARGRDGLPLPVGPGRVGPLSAEQREVEVRLPAERTIEGRVLAPGAASLAGVLLTASPPPRNARDGGGRPQSRSQARTDAQGRFRLGGLDEGDYVVGVSASPEYMPMPTQTVAAGARNLEVRLRRGVSARIRVSDASNKAVGGATVSATVASPVSSRPGGGGAGAPGIVPAPPMAPDEGEGWSMDGDGGWRGSGGGASTAQDGSVLLRGLDGEARYALRVQAPTGRDDVRAFRQEGWIPADTDVRLERGYVISGSVRDSQGRLVAGARLTRRNGESAWSGVSVNGDGTFRLTGLEPGPVTLRATAPGVRRQEADGAGAAELTVQAGAENVVLTVDPGLTLLVRIPNLAERTGERGDFLRATLLRWQEGRWAQADSQWDRAGKGSITFSGLKADGRYAVWIPPTGDDLFGWASDLRPGEVSLRLEHGGTIRGRVTAPTGVTQRHVAATGEAGQQVGAEVDAEGRYELIGLPPGRWKVQSWGQAGEQRYRAEGEASTGGTLDLTLVALPR